MVNLNDISYCLQNGKALETSALVTRALEEKYPIETVVQQGLIAGIRAAEERYKRNEILIPEVCMAVRAMNWGIKSVKRAIASGEQQTRGTVVLGSVDGDSVNIITNLIAVMMEGMGLRVVNLGRCVPASRFIDTAIAEKAQLIACSAMLVSTMVQMKNLVQAAITAGIRNQVKILIMGKPVTDRYCQIIGADMYAPDAVSAANIAAEHCAGLQD